MPGVPASSTGQLAAQIEQPQQTPSLHGASTVALQAVSLHLLQMDHELENILQGSHRVERDYVSSAWQPSHRENSDIKNKHPPVEEMQTCLSAQVTLSTLTKVQNTETTATTSKDRRLASSSAQDEARASAIWPRTEK